MVNLNKDKQETVQPLMSTGTVEPGFKWEKQSEDKVYKPKIGDTLVGSKSETYEQ